MALLDFLKNKKEKDKANEKKADLLVSKETKTQTDADKSQIGADKISDNQRNISVNQRFLPGKNEKFSYTIVKEPHISEKGTILSEKNKYVFRVYDRANKPEIKKAVEGIYGVNVLAVNVVRIPKKKRKLGRTEGFKKAYSKAIVTIKEGQKIEIF